VFLDEYTPAGVFVQSVAMPATGASGRLVASGTATTEGFLSRSEDGRYLVVPGYDAALGATVTTSTTVPRVIGRVDGNGVLDASTATVISTTNTNTRQINVSADQLYLASGAGTVRMDTIGTGLPTTSGQTTASLPGFPTAAPAAFNSFFVVRLDGGPGVDTV